MEYRYTHTSTQATTGYFACLPPPQVDRMACIAWLEEHPNDTFMHRHLLRELLTESTANIEQYIHTAQERPVFAALLYEVCTLDPQCTPLLPLFSDIFPEQPAHGLLSFFISHTPLPYLAWSAQSDTQLHQAWLHLFQENIQQHRMLPLLEDVDLPPLFPEITPDKVSEQTKEPLLHTLHRSMQERIIENAEPVWARPPAQETAQKALETLLENDIIAGVEMRHEASLSPIALLRRWNLAITVVNGSNNYSLKGEATTYGRGLSVADARASYAMEMVERASSYASVGKEGILGLTRSAPLIKARYSELLKQGIKALNPADIPSEAPYLDQSLYWMEGLSPYEHGMETVLVPAQLVYLFSNFDEPELAMASSSTGLASGNILAEAKVAALTEVIERDAEATTPYDRWHCFQLTTDDPRLSLLLQDYAARGIHVHFQDMTTELGMPCYTCFVVGARGVIARGTGAGLDGRRAALSALTETPYPYPHGAPSAPPLRGIPEKKLEELPCFLLNSPENNLTLIEQALIAQGRRPIYIELTQQRFNIPVVKAIVPHMEPTADFDSYTRVSKQLYTNYLRMANG